MLSYTFKKICVCVCIKMRYLSFVLVVFAEQVEET